MHRREAFEWACDRVKIGQFARMGFDINGVVHVGASDGYEIQFYLAMGITHILAFEPLPSAFKLLSDSYQPCGVDCIYVALGDYKGESSFYVTEGDGQGSSILLPVVDSIAGEMYPNLEEIVVPVRRFDEWANNNLWWNPHKADCLVVDVQGFEYEALVGFGAFLRYFDFLNIECSRVAIYEDGKIAEQVIDFLRDKGFTQITPTQDHDDILFVRSSRLDEIPANNREALDLNV